MKGSVKGSLLENLLQDSKIPEVERGQPQSAWPVELGENPWWEWVGDKTPPELPKPLLLPANWWDHHWPGMGSKGGGGGVGRCHEKNTDGGGKKARSVCKKGINHVGIAVAHLGLLEKSPTWKNTQWVDMCQYEISLAPYKGDVTSSPSWH
jgi:hypothetical protein